MKKLFLVDGAACYVKEDLIKYINSKENSTCVKKFTTRKERKTDSEKNSDLNFIDEKKFAKLKSDCYCYNYGEESDGYGEAVYGIPKLDIDEAINNYENIFIIVRSSECANEIIKEYGEKIKVISVLIYPDKQYTRERIENDPRYDNEDRQKELMARPNRINEVLKDYFYELNFFNRTILLSDASEEHLHLQLNQLIRYCDEEPYDMLFVSPKTSYQLIKPLIGYKKDINKQLSEHGFENNIFLMMKYRDDERNGKYTNTDIYQLINQIVKKSGFNCVRADQIEWTHLTDEFSYNPLAVSYCCKYGIALIDQPEDGDAYNSNVIYELGMMAAQNKSCILLRDESVDKIPFDLITTIHRTYNSDNYIEEISFQLNSWLKKLKK